MHRIKKHANFALQNRKTWSISVAVSTPPSHGGDSGSSPGSTTKGLSFDSPFLIYSQPLAIITLNYTRQIMKEEATAVSNEIRRHKRVVVADVLRGVAVMGIVLLHNIEHFNFYSFPDKALQPAWLNFTDKAIWDSLFFAFGGKAYAIFALLFGFSFFIQDDNQKMKGNDFRARFCWRLLLLFVIGCIDAVFFTAEILVMYSLVGIVLVATCRLTTRTLLILASIFLLQPMALFNIGAILLNPDFEVMKVPTSELWGATFAMQSGGSFMQTAVVNLWEGQLASLAWAWDHGRIFQTAALFILGMVIGRQGWMLKEYQKGWGIAACWALPLFCALRGLDLMLPDYILNKDMLGQAHLLLSSLYNLCFMILIVAGVLFLFYNTTGTKEMLCRLIPYGRMSMSNYVSQSIIGSFIYYNWGLGLHDRLGITASFLVGIVIFLAQLSFCRIWMKRFSHGPMEGTWKRLTWIGAR